MPFIQNVAAADIKTNFFKNPGNNSVLIQIADNDMDFPETGYPFKEIHQFKFLDVEEYTQVNEGFTKFTDDQAKSMIDILERALHNNANVIVHCHMGICRSGAVCEVGVIMGFDDTERFRKPNLLVKHKMLKILGMYPYENEGL